MSPETLDILKRTSTASIASLLFKKGLRNQFIQGVSRLNTARERMVGPAFTLRHILAREDLNPISVFQDPAHPQRRAVEEIPEGHVLVMDCRRDDPAAFAKIVGSWQGNSDDRLRQAVRRRCEAPCRRQPVPDLVSGDQFLGDRRVLIR